MYRITVIGCHYAQAISVHRADGSYGILEELSESQKKQKRRCNL